jgi:hypothetical protein
MTMFEREFKEAKKGKTKFDSCTAIESLILTLFQFKISGIHSSAKEELDHAEKYLENWLQTLPAATVN